MVRTVFGTALFASSANWPVPLDLF